MKRIKWSITIHSLCSSIKQTADVVKYWLPYCIHAIGCSYRTYWLYHTWIVCFTVYLIYGCIVHCFCSNLWLATTYLDRTIDMLNGNQKTNSKNETNLEMESLFLVNFHVLDDCKNVILITFSTKTLNY